MNNMTLSAPISPQEVTAFILAGGFGTRLRSVVHNRPKVLAEVLGRPFAFHLLDRLHAVGIRKAVFCTGYLAEQFEQNLGNEYRDIAIGYSREEHPLGTAGALRLAMLRHPCSLGLALNGDSLVNADLTHYLSWFRTLTFDAALLLTHVEDTARFGDVRTNATHGVLGFEEKGGAGPGWINAGVYLLRPEALETVPQGQEVSIEREVFPLLAQSQKLGALKSAGEFLDIGTPESYTQAGLFLLGRSSPIIGPAIFLDRDGTIITERHYLCTPEGVELLPGAADGLRKMRELGLPLVLVTNQSGVGRGYFGSNAVERVHGRLLDLLEEQGISVDAIYMCPHSPGANCDCRKPLPGLLHRAARELGVVTEQSFVIGDKPCDVHLGLVENATAILVRTGYGAEYAENTSCRPHHVVDDLAGAAEWIKAALLARNRPFENR